MSTLDRIERICGRSVGERALRTAVMEEIRNGVPCDAYAWLLTDPETCVGSSPLAETPSLADLPALIRLKYLTTTNRWTSLRSGASVSLFEATAGNRSQSRMWAELLSGYGVTDVASTVFRDPHGCWGFLDLWRCGGTFTARERDLVGRVGTIVTPALRRSLASTFALSTAAVVQGSEPVLLLLSEDLETLTQTPQADAYLRALLPTDAERFPVPAAAYNVAAQLLAQEEGVDAHPPWARVNLLDGLWVTLRAARMLATSPFGGASIAVSIEPTRPAERTVLYARVVGLTDRETELLGHLVGGSDTHELARRMFVSEHTVQDHLKSVFAKTGTKQPPTTRRTRHGCRVGGSTRASVSGRADQHQQVGWQRPPIDMERSPWPMTWAERAAGRPRRRGLLPLALNGDLARGSPQPVSAASCRRAARSRSTRVRPAPDTRS